MTSRHRWLGSGLVLAAVATAGFLGLRGGVALREEPQPVGQGGAAPSRWASGTRPSTSSRPPIDETPPAAVPVLEGSEGEEAALLVARMGKLVSDLEYSPGLPEPQQQTVAPQPEPWRPGPEPGRPASGHRRGGPQRGPRRRRGSGRDSRPEPARRAGHVRHRPGPPARGQRNAGGRGGAASRPGTGDDRGHERRRDLGGGAGPDRLRGLRWGGHGAVRPGGMREYHRPMADLRICIDVPDLNLAVPVWRSRWSGPAPSVQRWSVRIVERKWGRMVHRGGYEEIATWPST